jgi:hypothetical protein
MGHFICGSARQSNSRVSWPARRKAAFKREKPGGNTGSGAQHRLELMRRILLAMANLNWSRTRVPWWRGWPCQ